MLQVPTTDGEGEVGMSEDDVCLPPEFLSDLFEKSRHIGALEERNRNLQAQLDDLQAAIGSGTLHAPK